MKEIWKKVRGFENYEVSNYGKVKSLNYKRTGKEKLLSLGKDIDGYLFVHLWKNGFVKSFRINRLVYMTFVGEIPEDIQVNHIDEDKENNRVENLNLMTCKENIRWGTGNARRSAAHKGKKLSEEHKAKLSAAHKGKKLSEETKEKMSATRSKPVQALDKVTGEVIMEFPSAAEAGRQGFNHRHISECCNGKRKSHKGFIWRYAV